MMILTFCHPRIIMVSSIRQGLWVPC